MTLYFAGEEYAKDVLANPQNYISMALLKANAVAELRIKKAATLQELKKAFTEETRRFKGDQWFIDRLTVAKDERKAVLEVQA